MGYDRIMRLKCTVCNEWIVLAGLRSCSYDNQSATRSPEKIDIFLQDHSLFCGEDGEHDVFTLEYEDTCTGANKVTLRAFDETGRLHVPQKIMRRKMHKALDEAIDEMGKILTKG